MVSIVTGCAVSAMGGGYPGRRRRPVELFGQGSLGHSDRGDALEPRGRAQVLDDLARLVQQRLPPPAPPPAGAPSPPPPPPAAAGPRRPSPRRRAPPHARSARPPAGTGSPGR